MATAPSLKQADKPQAFYRPELDVLRFFAFFAVFMFHITFRDPAFYSARGVPIHVAELLAALSEAGNMGVDLFFALSAYLITTLLLREKEALGTVNLRSFYIRRILRIWPLYFLAVTLGTAWFVVNPNDFFPKSYAIAYLFLVGNWMYMFGSPGSPFAVLWSVSVEEQFYLTWPLLLRRLRSRKTFIVFALCLLLFTITVRAYAIHYFSAHYEVSVHNGSYVVPYLWSHYHFALDDGIMANTLTRLDGIAVGILIAALLSTKVPRIKGPYRVLLLAPGLACFLFVGGYFTDGLPSVVVRITAAAVASGFFLCAVLGSTFAPRPLIFLGKISYGLYIYHQMCIRISGHILGNRMKSYFGYSMHIVLSLTITVVVAALSYRWIETPFLRLKQRFTRIESRPV